MKDIPQGFGLNLSSPVGPLGLVENGSALTHLFFGPLPEGLGEAETPLLLKASRQLDEYFAGRRRSFDLPLAPAGTEFRQLVWQALLEIPYGETRSYGDLARAIGRDRSCRAVGGANHHNPLSIIIPCHRVVGKNGGLVGYGGGLEIKERLLRLEREAGESQGLGRS